MNALLSLRSRMNMVLALGVMSLGVIALSAFRIAVPVVGPEFELLAFGWLGIALGRLTIGATPASNGAPAPDAAAKSDRVDSILRSIARLIQAHASVSEAYSERLKGADAQLSQQGDAASVRDIVVALIQDNRQMRDKLSTLRDRLEEARLQVLQLRTNLERSEEAGMRDVVTLIGNRRYFDATFAEEIERARRTGSDFCLALADLDRFKLVNDRFGHLVGDRLLRLFAEILVQNLRGQDRVARFGGEEFALLLPGARLEDAIAAMERIRKTLEAKQWTVEPTGEPVGAVTASFGVAKLRFDDTGVDLIKRVDEHLYKAKTNGRNCVVAESVEASATEPAAPKPKRVANG